MLLLALVACARDDGRETVVLWHTYVGDERAALQEIVDDYNRAGHDTRIEAVGVAYDNFADKITSAIPNGNGPDLFIFAHDRLGDWRASGVIEPIEFYVDEPLADQFRYQALALLAQGDSLYGLPLAEKWTALFYNTELVASPPATTDELRALAAELRRRDTGTTAMAYQNVDLFGHAPWLHAFGARVLDPEGRPDLHTPAAVAALEYVRDLADDGLVVREAEPVKVATMFNEGDAAMVIAGPWFMADATGVPWAVAPLPRVSETGRPLQPFYGAEGVFMSARARDKERAFAAMRLLTGDAAAELRARRARQMVPNHAVLRLSLFADDPALAAFARQLEHTVPMPATPAMRLCWAPYKEALQKVIAQGAHPGDALAAIQRQVEAHLEAGE